MGLIGPRWRRSSGLGQGRSPEESSGHLLAALLNNVSAAASYLTIAPPAGDWRPAPDAALEPPAGPESSGRLIKVTESKRAHPLTLAPSDG